MGKILLLALIGLPAAGKTSFCHMLSNTLKKNLIHICYDHFFTITPENNNSYGLKRKEMIELIKNTIISIQSSLCIPDCIKASTRIFNEIENEFVILIDDNNYYAGMRYELYKICKEFKICFGQVYFECSLQSTLTRNLHRELRVPEEIIYKMNERLEKPCSSKNSWERNTCNISIDNYDIKLFEKFVEESFANVVEEKIITDNPIVPQTKLHLVDLMLRKSINERITKIKSNKDQIQVLSKSLSQKKKEIMRNIKLGAVNLPEAEDGYEHFVESLLD